MSEPLSEERLEEIRQRLAEVRREHKAYGRVTFTVRWDMKAMDELLDEITRLRVYEADAADRFAAVVRQRDAAEAEVRRLKEQRTVDDILRGVEEQS